MATILANPQLRAKFGISLVDHATVTLDESNNEVSLSAFTNLPIDLVLLFLAPFAIAEGLNKFTITEKLDNQWNASLGTDTVKVDPTYIGAWDILQGLGYPLPSGVMGNLIQQIPIVILVDQADKLILDYQPPLVFDVRPPNPSDPVGQVGGIVIFGSGNLATPHPAVTISGQTNVVVEGVVPPTAQPTGIGRGGTTVTYTATSYDLNNPGFAWHINELHDLNPTSNAAIHNERYFRTVNGVTINEIQITFLSPSSTGGWQLFVTATEIIPNGKPLQLDASITIWMT